jgi:hypothetical protein
MSDYDNEYFELKYLEEINDLFLSFKNESELFNLNLFEKNDNFMDLFDFIYSSIQINSDEDLLDENYDSNDEEFNLY